mgnify:CR=1 FL=1
MVHVLFTKMYIFCLCCLEPRDADVLYLYLLCVMSPEPESDKGRGAGAELPDIRVDGPQGTRTLLRDEAGEAGEIHRVTTNT